MFGDGGHDHGDHGIDLGSAVFAYLMWREMQAGRLDADGCLRAGCLLVSIIGGAGAVLLLILGAMSGGGGSYVPLDSGLGFESYPALETPFRGAALPTWTPEPWTPEPLPSPLPEPSPSPSPITHRLGEKVSLGDGWSISVTKLERWRPSGYDEPGWRLLTAWVVVGMPATDECVFAFDQYVRAPSGETYQGWDYQGPRAPNLFACGDYHRPTTQAGWITFEVRDADAKGLVLTACPSMFGCDAPAMITIS